MNKIVLGNIKGFDVVNIDDIIRLESSNNYTTFFLKNGTKTLISKTIGQYEKLLGDKGFFRIHQSHIVNLNYVRSYFKEDGGKVLMVDNSILSISRNKRPDFIRIFE